MSNMAIVHAGLIQKEDNDAYKFDKHETYKQM